MTPLHIFMALSVTFLWGTNFVAMKESLISFPPFLNLTLRFLGVAFPFLFFVPLPKHQWKVVVKFSCFQWMIQLVFINLALHYGVSPGMAAMFIQTKAIAVLVLAVIFYGYKLHRNEILGVMMSLGGILLLGHSVLSLPQAFGYLFLIPAVLSISFAHLIFKESLASLSPMTLTVWAAVLAWMPMLVLSLIFEGPDRIIACLQNFRATSVYALAFTVFGASLIGTSTYIYLLKYYGPERIVPFNVLIPLWSFIASTLFYNEQLSLSQALACGLIMLGLLFNQYKPQVRQNPLSREKR